MGDSNNNVTHSLALLCDFLELKFSCAAPKGYWMDKKIVKKLKRKILQTTNPKKAVENVDAVVTDTWIGMGNEKEKKKRLKIFPPYQVNKKLMNSAKKDALFLHCLPVYRNHKVTPAVVDGKQSVVFDETENRLHVQKLF